MENATPGETFLRYRWIIFTVLAAAYFFVYFHRLSLSVVADDLVHEFKTTASMMGVLGSIYFYCYAAMQLPAGLLSDSIGPRKTVTFFLLIASFGSILFGLAPNMETAFIARIFVGFGVSMVFIPTMKILAQWFKAEEFASMAGLLNAVGGVGVLAATWFLALMTSLFGWRLSFEIIGICTLLLLIFIWIFVRDSPADKGWPLIEEIDPGVKVKDHSEPEKTTLLQGAWQVLSNRHFWPVAIWFFLDCGIFFGFGALWGGPYLMHVYGMSRAESGAILSMIAWGMIIGSPVLGFLSDKILKSRKKIFIIFTSLLTLEFLILCLFPSQLPTPVLYIIIFLFSVSSSSTVAIGFTTTKELFPVKIAGTSVGTVNLFPFLGGAIYMPVLGRILDMYPTSAANVYSVQGYTAVFYVLLGTSVAALICTFIMKETFTPVKPVPQPEQT